MSLWPWPEHTNPRSLLESLVFSQNVKGPALERVTCLSSTLRLCGGLSGYFFSRKSRRTLSTRTFSLLLLINVCGRCFVWLQWP